MVRADQRDSTGGVLVTVLLVLGLVVAIGLGAWAFSGRQDYKNKSDQKAAAAVVAAKKVQADKLQKQFDEQAKAPYQAYRGSVTYGTISFNYPKSWSAYVDETNSSEPINGYFHPSVVPAISGPTAFALRLELLTTPYSQVLQQYQSQITTGTIKAAAYIPPKMKKVANVQPGTKLDGAIGQSQQGAAQNGTMVIIKVRDKTLKIYTQSTSFGSDFANIILPSLTFVP